MNRNLIYQIRDNKNIYTFLKYNSYLYKKIIRNEINIKDLERLMKKEFKLTAEDKLKNMSNKIELANTFLSIMK